MYGTIGIDIGGTKVAVGLVDGQGTIVSRKSFSTAADRGADRITAEIAKEVRALINEGILNVTGVGVGMAGQIDAATGLVHFAPNLQWRDYPFAERLSSLLGIPVAVTNDVRAAAWGEWTFGGGKGFRDLVCLFVGTGIGSGIIVNGKMLEGATNCAGEMGHIVIDINGPKCHCGGTGCLEAFAGGWAIGEAARKHVAQDPTRGSKLLELAGGDLASIAARHVSQASLIGDPLASEILDFAVKGLVGGVVSVVNAFNPACIILGGGVIEGNRGVIARVEAGVREKALQAATKQLVIEGAALKGDAGVIGAATYIRSKG